MLPKQRPRKVNNLNRFLAGLLFLPTLLGSLIGAGVMLLMAPQSGKKTRKQLWRRGQDMREQTTETIEDGMKQVRAKAHKVSTNLHKQAEELQQRGQDMIDQQKERWAPSLMLAKQP
ncbi:MAG: YtxH domain-containing protein [Chloroflexi bacterium]|nr:YtxH domain-containing protein [Chloroflexota bacterium]